MHIREILAIAAPVMPVIVIEQIDHAVPLAQALVKGGITVLEITLRTAPALEAVSRIREAVPEAIVGVGTVITPHQLADAKEAGAQFAVSPGFTKAIGQRATAIGLRLLPGVANASDMMAAMALRYNTFKFFPAEAAGGVAMLKAWQSPFPDALFCPTGGISLANYMNYLALKNVACVGGSWLAPSELMTRGEWDKITQLAQEVRTKLY